MKRLLIVVGLLFLALGAIHSTAHASLRDPFGGWDLLWWLHRW